MSNLVGYITLPAAISYCSYEYAGAGEQWELNATVVPLYKEGMWIVGKRPGVRIDSWFQDRFGELRGSDNRDTTRVRGEFGIQMREYEVENAAKEGHFRYV